MDATTAVNANNILVRASRLDLMRNALWRRRKAIEHEIKELKLLTENALNVETILKKTKEKIEKETIEGYSGFLTSFFHAVFPEYAETKKIEVTLEGSGQRQRLGFYVVDHNGYTEDIFHGNGGALTNVISTGLRIISVYRSKALANVIFLDEQDCWISPDRVSYYYNALEKIANIFDIQIISVTHHDVSLFDEIKANLIKITSQGSDIQKCTEDSTGFISEIKMKNIRAHEDLELNFKSGLNILYGKNNIGKSTVINALYIIFANGGDDSVIKHGHKEASIDITFANGSRLLYTRKDKTPKTYYSLFEHGKLIDEGRDLSEKASRLFGIGTDTDILSQFGMQKEPVFLLNAPGSKVLKSMSVGNESEWIDNILEKWRSRVRNARQKIRLLDEEFKTIEEVKKEITSHSRTLKRKIREIEKEIKEIQHNQTLLQNLKTFGMRYKALINAVEGASKIQSLEAYKKDIQTSLLSLNEKTKQKELLFKIGTNINELNSRLKEMSNLADARERLPSSHLKEIALEKARIDEKSKFLEHLNATLKNLNDNLHRSKDIEKEKKTFHSELIEIKKKRETIFKENGNICPCCNQPITKGSKHEKFAGA